MAASYSYTMASCLLFCIITSPGPGVFAQDAQPSALQACNNSISMPIDLDQFAGIWWEVARQPASTYFCTEVNVTVQNTDQLFVATTYSNTPDYPWVNQTMTTNATVQNMTAENYGYNVSYWNPPNNTPYTVFKILNTDYTNYAYICGFSNITDNSTYFGLILTRTRVPTTTFLNALESSGSELYENFPNGTMTTILQGGQCYASGSGHKALSLLAAALMFLLLCHFNN